MNTKGPVVAGLSALALSAAAWGGIVGPNLLVEDVSSAVNTPSTHVTYRFYVEFDSPGDTLVEINSADVTATNPWFQSRDLGGACANFDFFDLPPDTNLFDEAPGDTCDAAQYDTFIAIGDATSDTDAFIDFTFPPADTTGTPFGATTLTGRWFDTTTPAAPVDGRVLVMQLTVPAGTCIAGTVVAVDGASNSLQLRVAAPDPDADGLSDCDETSLGTGPIDSDSDDDGLLDGAEVFDGLCTDPLDPDSDDDGLVDGQEELLLTDPCHPDSDADGLNDGAEVDLTSDPLNPDTDGDGLLDGEDPDPLSAGSSAEQISSELTQLCHDILALDLSHFTGPNQHAKAARRAVLAIHACLGAALVDCGNYGPAILILDHMHRRVDGVSPPPDWMTQASSEREQIAADILELIDAINDL